VVLTQITPTEGATVEIESLNTNWQFNGSAWVLLGSLIAHDSLAGLEGGSTGERNHLSDVQVGYLPTSGEKAALAGTTGTPDGTTNKYVTSTDTRMTDARTPASHDNTYHSVVYATKSYVDGLAQGLDWQESTDYSVNYVKIDTGAPTGTPSAGELCLNTFDKVLYAESGLAWDAGTLCVSGARYVFFVTGSDVSGNSGTYTSDKKIYQYDGSTISSVAPTEGMATWIMSLDSLWVYNGTNWVIFGSTMTHNALASVMGDGGGYHLSQDQYNAMALATLPATANPAQMLADRAKMPWIVKFRYDGGLAISQTDVEPYEASGLFQRILMPKAFHLLAITVQLTADRTAGSLVVEPTIDGTKLTPTGLNLMVDDAPANDAKAAVAVLAASGYNGTAGQKIGVKLTSDGTWAPVTASIEVTLFGVFD
jgi:hypothetical protein